MMPENRRIARPRLPPDVLDAGAEMTTVRSQTVGDGLKSSRALAVVRALIGGGLVAGLSVGAAWGARRYVTTSPRFAVTSIVVTGQTFRTAEQIAAEAGIVEGHNVFALDLDRARARLLTDPWISEAQLSRRLPGKVTIQVSERDAAAIVALPDTYLATRDGDIFKRWEPGEPADLPVVTGLTVAQVTEDRAGARAALKRALDLAADYESDTLAKRAMLEEVHLAPDGTTSLVLGKDGVLVALGEPPFRRKLEQATRVFAELDRRGAKADAILMDNSARPERVVVRVR